MPQPAARLRVAPAQQRALEHIANSSTTPSHSVRRARALLLAAEGASDVEIARCCGVAPRTVARWRQRFREAGVGGLDRNCPGRVPPVELSARRLRVTTFGPDIGIVLDDRRLRLVGRYVGATQRALATRPADLAPDAGVAAVVDSGHVQHDLMSFLKRLDWYHPGAGDLVVLLDRISSDFDRYTVDRWLAHPKRRRFHIYVAPTTTIWHQLLIGPASVDPMQRGQWILTRRGVAAAQPLADPRTPPIRSGP